MSRKKQQPLTGARIVITGAGRGIGFATLAELHRRGAQLAIGDIDVEAAKQAAAQVGPDVAAFQVDVADIVSFHQFVAESRDTLGGIDVLVNNAGIMPIGPFLDISPEKFKRAVDINLTGVINGMHSVLPGMLAVGSGHIVNVASSAGKSAVPGGFTYCATKSAVITLTEGARLEFGSRGVSFTCVMPAFTNTELISGTNGVRFFKNVEPGDVALAIADGIETKALDVFVPKSIGPMLKTQPLLGRRLRDFLNRRMGAYNTFLDIDQSSRTAYDQRMNRS